jgi:pimeloyl-ACP methyl ester carboxylesterase
MGGIIAQKIAVKYPHLVEALVLVDTTSHGIDADATADVSLAAVDKGGAEKTIQDLSDISFGSSAAPALVEWARREVFKRRNSSLGRRSVRSVTPIPAALFLRSRRLP